MLKLLTWKVRLIAIAALLVFGLLFLVLIAVAMIVSTGQAEAQEPDPLGCVPINPAPDDSEYEEQQIANAQIIDRTAEDLGLSGRASRIAIIASLGESSLINIDYDDDALNPDGSVADGGGLFQQQPSQGWGTWEQIMDPVHATTSFLTGPNHDRRGGLVSIPGWETRPDVSQVIHEVQINANPAHYEAYYAQADAIIQKAGIDVNRPGEHLVPALPSQAPDSPGGCNLSGDAAYPLDLPYNMTSGWGPRNTGIPGASTWHPAYDLQNWPGPCGQPFYAVLPGTVVTSDRLWLSVQHPEGFTVHYLHSYKSERVVDVGDSVSVGDDLGLVGNEGPSGGCHLDIRISIDGSQSPDLQALTRSPENVGDYVKPDEFFALFGLDICPVDFGNGTGCGGNILK